MIAADLVRLGRLRAPCRSSAAPPAIVALAGVAGHRELVLPAGRARGLPNLVADADLAAATSLLQATDWVATARRPAPRRVARRRRARISSTGSTPHVPLLRAAARAHPGAAPAERAGRSRAVTGATCRRLRRRSASRALLTVLVAVGLAMLATGLVNVSEIFLAKRARSLGRLRLRPALGGERHRARRSAAWSAASLVERRALASSTRSRSCRGRSGSSPPRVAPNVWVAALAMVVSGFGNGARVPRCNVLLVQRGAPDRYAVARSP